MKLLRLSCCLLLMSLAFACDDDDDFDDDFDDDVDEAFEEEDLDDVTTTTAYYEDWSTDAVYAMTDPFEDPYYFDDGAFLTVSEEAPVGDPEAVAVIVADSADLYFTPAECTTVERNESELTYMLSGCVGPFGTRMLDGVLRVSFSDDEGQIAFDIAGEQLRLDGDAVELAVNGVYSAMGTAKTVQYTSSWTLPVGDRMVSGEFDNELAWTTGSQCVTRNANGQVMATERAFDVDVDNYTRCAGQCPSAGVVTYRGDDQTDTVTMAFDGTGLGLLTRTDGSQEQIDLDCD